jgi:hypothetical protein
LLVRGPLSLAKLISGGAVDSRVAVGDPALLLSLYLPRRNVGEKIAVVPHFMDYPAVMDMLGSRDDVEVVNVLETVESVVEKLSACRVVLSSSLHGLIAAHSYNIPATWVSFGNRLAGDGFKFQDYLLSQGYDRPMVVRAEGQDWLEKACACAALPPRPISPPTILSSFPVDLFPLREGDSGEHRFFR